MADRNGGNTFEAQDQSVGEFLSRHNSNVHTFTRKLRVGPNGLSSVDRALKSYRGRRKEIVMNKKLPQRLVRNAGVFYVCYRLSQMGWNATPATRYSSGPNVVIDSEDAERTWRLKVRSLSKRDPVPLGKDPNIDADWVVVCTRVREDSPRCYVLTSGEVRKLATRDKHGPSHWLDQRDYDTEVFAERWDRIGSGLA